MRFDNNIHRFCRRKHSSLTNMGIIYQQARNVNLIWRFQILSANSIDPLNAIEAMEKEIFWDLLEIDITNKKTKGLRMVNMDVHQLPRTIIPELKISVLDLSNNIISKIPSLWFQSLVDLKVLIVKNNEIKSIPWHDLAQLANLTKIDLSGNPLNENWKRKFYSFRRVFLPLLKNVIL